MATESFFSTYELTDRDADLIAAALENAPTYRPTSPNAASFIWLDDPSKLWAVAKEERDKCQEQSL